MTEQYLHDLTFWLLIISVPGLLCLVGYAFYAVTSRIRVWWQGGARVFSYEGKRVHVLTFIKKDRGQ